MASRVTCSVLLVLLALLGPWSIPAQRETRHEKFHRQHVDFPKSNSELDARRYCNLMMQRRGMTSFKCKPFNTFIHGQPTDVDAICGDGGMNVRENYYNSHRFFELTFCRLVGGSSGPPNCNYRGRLSTLRIQIACQNGVPVHYQSQF